MAEPDKLLARRGRRQTMSNIGEARVQSLPPLDRVQARRPSAPGVSAPAPVAFYLAVQAARQALDSTTPSADSQHESPQAPLQLKSDGGAARVAGDKPAPLLRRASAPGYSELLNQRLAQERQGRRSRASADLPPLHEDHRTPSP